MIASDDWYKRFFRPGPPIMRLFSGYRGRIAAPFDGIDGIDGNIDAPAEAATLQAGFSAVRLTIDLAPDVVHSLGEDAFFGPMHADRQEAVVAAVERMAAPARHDTQAPPTRTSDANARIFAVQTAQASVENSPRFRAGDRIASLK